MVELRNDVMRRATFESASKEAYADDFDYAMHRTMNERLDAMREKQLKPKKRFPWFTIISILSCVPFFFMDGGDDTKKALATLSSLSPPAMANLTLSAGSIENAQQLLGGKTAKVTIEVNGQIVEREISMGDLEALKQQMQ